MRTSKCLILLSVAMVMFMAGNAAAVITGAACVDCHTMHNSQDGKVMRWDQPADATGLEGARALLRAGDCIGCHASDTIVNDGTNSIPQVDGNSYGVNTLAGGSFDWVRNGNDAAGHNVNEFNAADVALGLTPPGWDKDHPGARNTDTTWAQQLSCGGTYGCHGTNDVSDSFGAVQGAHHEASASLDGTTVGKSYRFLAGITGVEDADWEYTTSATDHNVYKGVARNNGTDDDASTISYLCAECHGKYHAKDGINGTPSTTMSNPWLRHPTDIDMGALPATSEYADYVYSVEAPAALSTPVDAAAANYDAEAIVTCLSCHRPHGSPNDDLLRWDYAGMTAGTDGAAAGTGCFRCHTTKDGI